LAVKFLPWMCRQRGAVLHSASFCNSGCIVKSVLAVESPQVGILYIATVQQGSTQPCIPRGSVIGLLVVLAVDRE